MPVPDGKIGEVVVTTLGVEGMPLLRFRTGDMCAKIVDQCKCGRNSYRLTPLVGRKNNMIKLKGTTLYPPAINDVVVGELKNRFRAHLRVAPIVEVCPVEEVQKINFPPKTRKPIKFIDQR